MDKLPYQMIKKYDKMFTRAMSSAKMKDGKMPVYRHFWQITF